MFPIQVLRCNTGSAVRPKNSRQQLALSDALLLHVLLQGHVLGGQGRIRQELKLALSDSCAAASEATGGLALSDYQ